MHFLSATLSFPHLFDTWLRLNDCFFEVFELSRAIFNPRFARIRKIALESSKTSQKQSFKLSQVSNRCGKESVKPEKMHAFLTGWDNIFLPNERHCAQDEEKAINFDFYLNGKMFAKLYVTSLLLLKCMYLLRSYVLCSYILRSSTIVEGSIYCYKTRLLSA